MPEADMFVMLSLVLTIISIVLTALVLYFLSFLSCLTEINDNLKAIHNDLREIPRGINWMAKLYRWSKEEGEGLTDAKVDDEFDEELKDEIKESLKGFKK